MVSGLVLWNVIAGLLVFGLLVFGRVEYVAGKRMARRMDFEARRAVRHAVEEWEARERRARVRQDMLILALTARADFLLETRNPPLRLLHALTEPITEHEFAVLAGES